MKRILVPLALAAALGAGPAGAGAATFKGVVVGKLRGSVLVASPAGVVGAFGGQASVGSRVAFVHGRLVVVGRANTARIRGIVVRRIGMTMFLSSNRHLVAVHSGRRLASASDTPPTNTTAAAGQLVSVQVSLGDGQLDVESEDDLGPATTSPVQIQATVTAVGTGTVTLTVNGQSLTLPVPGGLTLPQSLVGQTVTLNISVNGQNGEDDQVENHAAGSGTSGSGGDNSSGGDDGGGD
jgi:hypothetical protein